MSEVQIWKPQKPFEGTDLIPDLHPQGENVPAPPGGVVGRENVGAEDLILPSLQLLQGMSDPVTEGIEGAQPGKFWMPTMQEVFKPPIRTLLIHHSRSRALFPKQASTLKTCMAPDAVEGNEYGACEPCPHRKWGANGTPPACSESHNFVAWTDAGPAILRFAKTSYKAARNFLTTWTMTQKNLWAHPAIITVKKRTKQVSGQEKTYYIMDIRWDQREDVPPEFQENALQLYQQIQKAHKAGKLRTEEEDHSPPESESAPPPGSIPF